MDPICFIANYKATYLYKHIASIIEEAGIEVYWITVNKGLKKFLASHFSQNNVLLIDDTLLKRDNEAIGEFKLNELIYRDRSFMYQPQKGISFLTNIQKPVYDFLKCKNIRFVFGEITWAHEVLIKRICDQKKELSCCYLNPHTVRIPSNRFTFFSNEGQSEIYKLKTTDIKEVEKIAFEEPVYSKVIRNAKSNPDMFKGRKKKIVNELMYQDFLQDDPTFVDGSLMRKKRRWKEKINKVYYKALKKTPLDKIKTFSYIYFPLHKQPEASVDTLGRYYEDQKTDIINLWRVLPAGWKIVIKEHPTGIGDRGYGFYHELLRYKDIILANDKTSSQELLMSSQFVATITGTAAYEAALFEKKALTFVPTFF